MANLQTYIRPFGKQQNQEYRSSDIQGEKSKKDTSSSEKRSQLWEDKQVPKWDGTRCPEGYM